MPEWNAMRQGYCKVLDVRMHTCIYVCVYACMCIYMHACLRCEVSIGGTWWWC